MAPRDPRIVTVEDTRHGPVRTLHRPGCRYATGTPIRIDERGFGKVPANSRQKKRLCSCLSLEPTGR